MNYIYGYPLFEKSDIENAFIQNCFGENLIGCMKIGKDVLESIINDNNLLINNIIQANRDRVAKNTSKIILLLSGILASRHYDFGVIVSNPKLIIPAIDTIYQNTKNIRVRELTSEIYLYLIKDMCNTPNLWLYFNGFVDKELELIIKLKYSDLVIEHNNITYVKLLPQENFSLIFDFMDDICKIC